MEIIHPSKATISAVAQEYPNMFYIQKVHYFVYERLP
jgi:hypothetical protein